MAGPENAAKYKTPIFLAGSASAEFFADIGLCAFEAVKVRWHLSLAVWSGRHTYSHQLQGGGPSGW